MIGVDKIIDNYLKEITLVSRQEEENILGNEWRNISNDAINRAIAIGKVNKARCIAACRDEKCKQDCDLRSTTLVIRNLQSGITACRDDKRCVKNDLTRIINIAQRGDEKVRKYGFGTPFLRDAIAFASRMGFDAK